METIETPEQHADRMNQSFVIRCFELLMIQMLPSTNVDEIQEVAKVAEHAMTKVTNLIEYEDLRNKLYSLCPLNEGQAKALHVVVCNFAPNIVGAIVHKGQEIANGTYTAEVFFSHPSHVP